MVKNFMGMAVRPEIISVPDDDVIDSAPVRSLAMRWSYPRKAQVRHNKDKTRTGFYALASAGLVKITITDACESDHSSYSGIAQNCIVPDNVTSMKNVDPHGAHGNRRVFCQPVNPIPTVPIVGTTDLRNATKIPGAAAQLTLFYNGSVCVYDNVSPEKAQAIMLLAGNGPPLNVSSSPMTILETAIKPSITKSSFLDRLVANQPYNTALLSSSPNPISPIGLPHTYSRANILRAEEVHLYPNKVEVKVPTQSGAVQQFRKKSLARFLEKRKERLIYRTSPFSSKQSSDSCMGNTSSAATVDQWKY